MTRTARFLVAVLTVFALMELRACVASPGKTRAALSQTLSRYYVYTSYPGMDTYTCKTLDNPFAHNDLTSIWVRHFCPTRLPKVQQFRTLCIANRVGQGRTNVSSLMFAGVSTRLTRKTGRKTTILEGAA